MRLLVALTPFNTRGFKNTTNNAVEQHENRAEDDLFIGRGKFNLPINAAWSQEGRV